MLAIQEIRRIRLLGGRNHRAWTEALPLKYRIRKQRDERKIQQVYKTKEEASFFTASSPRSSRSNSTDTNSIENSESRE